MRKYISFDWAIKYILRDKANFAVLEGFLSVITGKRITIKNILESESNTANEYEKQNIVDLLAEDEEGVLYLFEVQNNQQDAYFHRMLFGSSRLISQHLKKGDGYERVKKVYSISIVYFDLGQGEDYAYVGKTIFRGIHKNDTLELSEKQKRALKIESVNDIFPEYVILKVNQFDDVARTPLEEWIRFLRDEEIDDNTTTPGLKEAKEVLDMLKMDADEQIRYDRRQRELMDLRSSFRTQYTNGVWDGRKEAEMRMAKAMMVEGVDVSMIMRVTGLTKEEIEGIGKNETR